MIRILYFFPENPIKPNQGNTARANFLLDYFKNKNIKVDLVGEYSNSFTENDILALKQKGLVNNGWVLKKNVKNLTHYLLKVLPEKLHKGLLSVFAKSKYKTYLDFNRTKKGYIEDFRNILKLTEYDYVIISYIYWAPLISKNIDLMDNSKLIIDTHDFITSQFQNAQHFNIGAYFNNEVKILEMFDQIWAISIEEYFLFSQFLSKKEIELIPHGLSSKTNKSHRQKIDLLYVASENRHNISSINWFFNKVHPLLPEDISITIVGKICNVIPNFKNVHKITYAENLEQLYSDTKICLCPMLSGTGLKIKVVEALSYSLPVVCNQRGLDGLLNKINNGCLSTESELEFANYIIKLLSDDSFYSKTKREAKSFFEKTLSQKTVYNKLDSLFINSNN